MELTSTRVIAAPRPMVWSALNDPATLKSCLPGCESIEPDGEDAYRVVIAAKVGPVSARFSGRLQLADVEPLRRYTLRFDGQGGAAGFANGNAAVTLGDADDGTATSLSYRVNAQAGGKLAQIGSRLADGAAAKIADDFFARFAASLAARATEVAPAAVAAAAGTSVPPSWQRHAIRWVAMAAIAVLLVLLYLQRGR